MGISKGLSDPMHILLQQSLSSSAANMLTPSAIGPLKMSYLLRVSQFKKASVALKRCLMVN
jgi:hypothetical protein